MASRLEEKYKKEVAPALMEKFGYKNIMEIPEWEEFPQKQDFPQSL